MIPLDRLRKMASSMDPDLHVCASELLRIRELAAEMPNPHDQNVWMGEEIELRDAAHATRLAEAQEEYRAAVQENVALIAQVAELKEECARLRKIVESNDDFERDFRAALSRGAKT